MAPRSIMRQSPKPLFYKIKMTSPIPDDVVIAAYFRDGKWQFQLCQVMMYCWYPSSPPEQHGVRGGRRRKTKRASRPRPSPPCFLNEVLEALCSAKLTSKTLQFEQNMMVRCNKVALLSSLLVNDGERFGTLAHWSLLVESTRSPNIVVYMASEKQMFVVCAKAILTQRVNTRSAICWIRSQAGLGFCVDDENCIFRIEVSRRCFTDDGEDPWGESLAQLVSTSVIATVFPSCSFLDV